MGNARMTVAQLAERTDSQIAGLTEIVGKLADAVTGSAPAASTPPAQDVSDVTASKLASHVIVRDDNGKPSHFVTRTPLGKVKHEYLMVGLTNSDGAAVESEKSGTGYKGSKLLPLHVARFIRESDEVGRLLAE